MFNITDGMANSLDPDQMLHSAASDKGLHCLVRHNCPIISCKYSNIAINHTLGSEMQTEDKSIVLSTN